MARIRQNLSSDSLFHFVSKMDYLLDIIKKGFVARYCYENLPFLNIPLGIPMKCFCDIPLGQIKVHIKNYKGYGIGITKKFAMNKKITPVIYVHNNSATLLNFLNNLGSSNSNSSSVLPYFKIYEETQKVANVTSIKRYYDEREWRFIPPNCDFLDLRKKTKKEIEDEINKSNKSLPTNYHFTIPLKDIAYLFVEKDIDVPLLIQEIKKINLIPNTDKDLLISKIITARQIQYDF